MLSLKHTPPGVGGTRGGGGSSVSPLRAAAAGSWSLSPGWESLVADRFAVRFVGEDEAPSPSSGLHFHLRPGGGGGPTRCVVLAAQDDPDAPPLPPEVVVGIAAAPPLGDVALGFEVVSSERVKALTPSVRVSDLRCTPWKRYACWSVTPDPKDHPRAAEPFHQMALNALFSSRYSSTPPSWDVLAMVPTPRVDPAARAALSSSSSSSSSSSVTVEKPVPAESPQPRPTVPRVTPDGIFLPHECVTEILGRGGNVSDLLKEQLLVHRTECVTAAAVAAAVSVAGAAKVSQELVEDVLRRLLEGRRPPQPRHFSPPRSAERRHHSHTATKKSALAAAPPSALSPDKAKFFIAAYVSAGKSVTDLL